MREGGDLDSEERSREEGMGGDRDRERDMRRKMKEMNRRMKMTRKK